MNKSHNFLKNWYGRYFGNYRRKYARKQHISPLCNLCSLKQNGNCLHLLSYCTNKHIDNLIINKHNKWVHVLADPLLAQTTTRCFILINASKLNNPTPNNTLPSWWLPCSYYHMRSRFKAFLHPDITCILVTTTPTSKLPLTPTKFSLVAMTYSPKKLQQEN